MPAQATLPDPVPASTPASTLASSIYRRLRQEIIGAAFPAGARLHTRQLCARYAVGLSPVREALSRLSSEGLVRQSDQRGFAVAPVNGTDLDELTRTRCWLDETGLRESIRGADAAWEEQVVLSFHRLSRIPRFLDGEAVRNPAWDDAHRGFHASLVAGCRSTWLTGYCGQLFDAFERYRNVSPFTAGVRPEHLAEHRAILDAVVARDEAAACILLNAHYERSATLVRLHLQPTGR